MKIQQIEFVKAAYIPSDLPDDDFPQIAFAGRSNVGKSSMINCLLMHGKIAHTSSQPGKTRSVNFIRINRRFYFVDLPGYGYARASKEERKRWKHLIEAYFWKNRKLRGLVQIIDARHGMTELDEEMIRYAYHLGVRFLVVATKADKLKTSEQQKRMREIRRQLEKYGVSDCIFFSAKTRLGRPAVLKWIEERLKDKSGPS
jgi:GTP-binding protein